MAISLDLFWDWIFKTPILVCFELFSSFFSALLCIFLNILGGEIFKLRVCSNKNYTKNTICSIQIHLLTFYSICLIIHIYRGFLSFRDNISNICYIWNVFRIFESMLYLVVLYPWIFSCVYPKKRNNLLYNQDSKFNSNIIHLSTFQFIFQFFQLAQ